MTEEQRFDFSRLQEEHVKAVQASRDKIQQWKRFKGDYEVLQTRLATLPDSHTHQIMVPFGRFAFMPGTLYHSNEVTVLLGDNWFLKTTCKHAIEITERRKLYVEEMLNKEKKTCSDWESRQSFTHQFQSTMHEHEDVVEIKEKYIPRAPGTEKVRKAWVPKGDVPPPRQVLPPSSTSRRQQQTETHTPSEKPPLRITVTHGEASSVDSDVDSDGSHGNDPLYTTPGDIATSCVQLTDDQSVTIGKKQVKWGPNQYMEHKSHDSQEKSHDPSKKSHDPSTNMPRPKAPKPFTGQVVERSDHLSPVTFDPECTRVSRFKAQRAKK